MVVTADQRDSHYFRAFIEGIALKFCREADTDNGVAIVMERDVIENPTLRAFVDVSATPPTKCDPWVTLRGTVTMEKSVLGEKGESVWELVR